MSKFQPFIKWSGSKRSQSQEILKYFPKKIEDDFMSINNFKDKTQEENIE